MKASIGVIVVLEVAIVIISNAVIVLSGRFLRAGLSVRATSQISASAKHCYLSFAADKSGHEVNKG